MMMMFCLLDQGNGDMNFTEIYQGIQRQFKLSKLNPATGYIRSDSQPAMHMAEGRLSTQVLTSMDISNIS